MREFEPRLKSKKISKVTIAKYIYILVIAVFLLGGISYGYTFFTQNIKVANGSIKTADLNIDISNQDILMEEVLEYKKDIELINKGNTNGIITLKLTKTSGIEFNDLNYGIIVDSAIQKMGSVNSDGILFTNTIMAGEKQNIKLLLWTKSGEIGTFIGKIDYDLKYLGVVASNISNITGKYVKFNCTNDNCETWRIVKVEDGRLVITREEDYIDALDRINSNRYNPNLSFNDSSLITSVSTDDRNLYLRKTTKISNGTGEINNPYILYNNVNSVMDKKIVSTISYMNNSILIGKQNIYYNNDNYISLYINEDNFKEWIGNNNIYHFKDSIVVNNDLVLNAVFYSNNNVDNEME